VPDPTTIDPDAWEHDIALLSRPGVDRAQLHLDDVVEIIRDWRSGF